MALLAVVDFHRSADRIRTKFGLQCNRIEDQDDGDDSLLEPQPAGTASGAVAEGATCDE